MFNYLKEHLQYLLRPNRFLNVDALRACAVLLVVVHHVASLIPSIAQGPLSGLCHFGARGVDLFFVISGFLFGSMLLGELQTTNGIDFRRFYRHRFLRIFPVYWFATIVSIPLCFSMGWCSLSSLSQVPKQLMLDLCFLHTLNGCSTAMQAWASWSLAIEIWFYAFIPVTLVGLHRISKGNEKLLIVMLALLAGAGFMLRVLLVGPLSPALNDHHVWLATSRPYVRFDELLIGVLAYILGRRTSAQASKPLLLVGGAVLFGAYQLMSRPLWSEQIALIVDWVYMPAVLSIGFACLLVGSIKAKFQHPLITFVANLSYSLYLMHAMLTLIVSRQPHEESFAPMFLVGSFGMAYLASLLVEYPFLKMYKKPVLTAQAKLSGSLRPLKMSATLSRAASSGGS